MSPKPAELAVIIPTLNEQTALPALLADLQAQQDVRLEVIVVDGGSADETRTLCRSLAAGATFPVKLISTNAGRAGQLNQGVLAARAPLLLFIHADTHLPSPQLLAKALVCFQAQRENPNSNHIAGHFGLQFVRSGNDHPLAYYFYESKTRLNRMDTVNGDQGFMLSRAFFQELGGFDESLPYMEDARLARKIFTRGRWITLPGRLSTSARRFETEGLKERQTLNAFMCNFDNIGLDEFFTEAAGAYRVQRDSRRLNLKPFLLLIHDIFKRRGVKGAALLWYKTGTYVAANAWQLAFLMDCADNFKKRRPPGEGPAPRLRFYDKHVRQWIESPPGGLAASALTFLWFYFLLFRSLLKRTTTTGKHERSV
jgi:rSAM/selenodomain-associated transferase 2